MDVLSNLQYAPGSRKRRKRIGRGQGSGFGGTSTKGHKGQKSRSGHKNRAWFEGGQMPLERRLPKRGFKNFNKKEFSIINIGDIQSFINNGKITETAFDLNLLVDNKLVASRNLPLKVLGVGDLTSKIEFTAAAFSKTAKEKIENAGGKAIIL